MMPFSPTNTPPPPSLPGLFIGTSSGSISGRGGIRPPSYQYSLSASRLPTFGKSYCTIVAIGYVAGFCAPPPHGVDDAAIDVG